MSRHPFLVNPENLPIFDKYAVWAGIKILKPDLADLLRNDPNVSALKRSFGATIRFTQAEIDEYLTAGKKFFESKQ